MTVVNKVRTPTMLYRSPGCSIMVAQFVVSGRSFNMTFLLLCIQSTVSVLCVSAAKRIRLISFRDFDARDAKMWFPISFMLVSVIYTGSKSLVSLRGAGCTGGLVY